MRVVTSCGPFLACLRHGCGAGFVIVVHDADGLFVDIDDHHVLVDGVAVAAGILGTPNDGLSVGESEG